MVATPVSFRMFLVKTGCRSSLAKKSPRLTSFSRRSLGSNWISMGAEATSAPPSIDRETVIRSDGLAVAWEGSK
jgi:hypothetical protein